jgi:hypothetical protein
MVEEEGSAAGTLKTETLLFAGRRKIPLLTLHVEGTRAEQPRGCIWPDMS